MVVLRKHILFTVLFCLIASGCSTQSGLESKIEDAEWTLVNSPPGVNQACYSKKATSGAVEYRIQSGGVVCPANANKDTSLKSIVVEWKEIDPPPHANGPCYYFVEKSGLVEYSVAYGGIVCPFD